VNRSSGYPPKQFAEPDELERGPQRERPGRSSSRANERAQAPLRRSGIEQREQSERRRDEQAALREHREAGRETCGEFEPRRSTGDCAA
jgi:hypothetical protein